jgi:hypothetical protein
VVGVATLLLVSCILRECAAATAAFLTAIRKLEREEKVDESCSAMPERGKT